MADRFATFNELRDKLRDYKAEDYSTFLPFSDLIDCAMVNVPHYNCARYKQYAKILLKDAVAKGCDPVFIQSKIDEYYVTTVLQEDKSNHIANLIEKIADDLRTADKVSVVPLVCGAGKSTAISYLIRRVIKQIIEKGDTRGILIVTDNTKRMTEYVEPAAERDPELRSFLDEHKQYYTLLRNEDLIKGLRMQAMSPVLIMTTQRYFSLSKEEIQHFLKWKDNGTRPLILFDEAIPLNDVITIGRRQINDISSALSEGLYYGEDHEERRWCINQWELVRKRVLSDIKKMEDDYAPQDFYFFYRFEDGKLTEDDSRFANFICKHAEELILYDKKLNKQTKQNTNTFETLNLIHHMLTQGCLYHCSKQGNWYHSNFSILGDNQEKVLELGAKVIVLDGTADIHPNYQQDYVDLCDGSKFSRGLDNLVLRFVGGIGTSKSQLADDEERIHLVHNYIRNLHPNKRIAAFTHNTAENNLRKYFAATAHFGDIKGKNDFRDYTCIAQLGHNRFPEYFYLTWFLWKNSEQLQALSGLSLEETSAYISELQKSPEYKNTVDRFLLADLEQNMFRSAIRQPDFVDPVHCYVFCNTDHYESLIREAQSRYSLLEASVEPVDASKSFEAERIENIPPEERTIAQRMIAVINAYTIGTEFTTRANPVKGRKCRMLLIDAGIDAKQYARAREKSSQLRKILEDMQTTRGYYVKK